MARSATTLCSINSRSILAAPTPPEPRRHAVRQIVPRPGFRRANTEDAEAPDNQLSHAQGDMTKNGKVIVAAGSRLLRMRIRVA